MAIVLVRSTLDDSCCKAAGGDSFGLFLTGFRGSNADDALLDLSYGKLVDSIERREGNECKLYETETRNEYALMEG